MPKSSSSHAPQTWGGGATLAPQNLGGGAILSLFIQSLRFCRHARAPSLCAHGVFFPTPPRAKHPLPPGNQFPRRELTDTMQPNLFFAVLAMMLGIALFFVILWEGFETIVLPRSVTRSLRLTRLFYLIFWNLTSGTARRHKPSGRRELFLSFFGPLSLPILLGFWAVLLVLSFALMEWSLGPQAYSPPRAQTGFGTDLYQSGVTFFTLGYGDITPRSSGARALSVLEAGVGFGFLGLVIGYLPVLYQAFSRREAAISRLDGRAGSPPTAGELLRRHAQAQNMEVLIPLLAEWETWASEILESHLSYPVLPFYRSQHDHQSWLAALTSIMDTCAVLMIGVQGSPPWQTAMQWQARMTFAMARHTIIDLAYVFHTAPVVIDPARLPPESLTRLRAELSAAGLPLCDGPEDTRNFTELRGLYEPYVHALGEFFLFPLPPWQSAPLAQDNWQTSAWDSMLNTTDEHLHFR